MDEWTGRIVCMGQLAGLSGESIGVGILFTWPVCDVNRAESRTIDLAPPTCMLPWCIWAAEYRLDCLMIGAYGDIVTIRIILKVADGPDHCQHLQIADGIPFLIIGQGATGIGHRMELPICLLLQQHSSKSLDAGVCIQHKTLVKIREGENW